MTNHDLCEPVQMAPIGSKIKKWTFRVDNNSHYHGVVNINESPLYLELFYRLTAQSPVKRVGLFRLNLPGLLRGRYIRFEPADASGPELRLRIVRSIDGEFFIQVNQKGPQILIGR